MELMEPILKNLEKTLNAIAASGGYDLILNKNQNGVIFAKPDFDLTPADPAELDAEIREIEAERRQRVPREPSCGCVFRNPPDAPAGQLIDQLGLAGKRCGDALISTQHANFIVNTGAARARDVLELIRTIRRVVKQETGIALDLEVQLIDLPDPK